MCVKRKPKGKYVKKRNDQGVEEDVWEPDMDTGGGGWFAGWGGDGDGGWFGGGDGDCGGDGGGGGDCGGGDGGGGD